MRILIVMPASHRHRSLAERLQAAGHVCTCVAAEQVGGLVAETMPFDAIVCDRVGPAAAAPLLQAGPAPSAILVAGAELGPDDDAVGRLTGMLHELATALAAAAGTGRQLAWQDLVLEPAIFRATRNGVLLPLTRTEYKVLECLVHHAGSVVTRRMLCDHVWSRDWHRLTNVVDVYVSRVRRKVDCGFAGRLVHTVRGVGYRLGPSS